MCRTLLGCGSNGQHLVDGLDNPWFAGGERSCLVEDDHGCATENLERRASLHDDAATGSSCQPRHEGDRRREDQRARCRHDQDGECRDWRVREDPAERCDPEGDRKEHDRGAIGQARRARTVRLGVLDEPHDPRVRRSCRRTERTDLDRLSGDGRPAADLLVEAAPDGQRLAGQCRLVEYSLAADEGAIHRHDLTGEDQELVAGRDVVGGNIDESTVLPPMCNGRCPPREGRQLAPRTSEGMCVEQLAARQHQRNHEPRRELAEDQRSDHREQRDDVGSELAANHPRGDADRQRDGGEDECNRPDGVARGRVACQVEHGADHEGERNSRGNEVASHRPIVPLRHGARIGVAPCASCVGTRTVADTQCFPGTGSSVGRRSRPEAHRREGATPVGVFERERGPVALGDRLRDRKPEAASLNPGGIGSAEEPVERTLSIG